MSLARFAFQACSLNHSDISPFRSNHLRSLLRGKNANCVRPPKLSNARRRLRVRARREHVCHAQQKAEKNWEPKFIAEIASAQVRGSHLIARRKPTDQRVLVQKA